MLLVIKDDKGRNGTGVLQSINGGGYAADDPGI